MQGTVGRRRRAVAALLLAGNTAWTIYAVVGSGGPAAAVELAGSATLVTDYRFRGVSLSGGDPAAEAGLTASTSDWFAGLEGVATGRSHDLRRAIGRTVEVDASAGWSRSLGLLTPSVGAIGYLYPGGGNPNAVEVFGSVAGALGPATLTLGVNYAPDQAAAAGGNLYTYASAVVGIPATPVSITAAVGRERGGFDEGRTKLDYRAGVDVRVGIATIGVKYIGNDVPGIVTPALRHATRDTVVGSVTLAF